jgi:uncharacterized OB-fold protein
MEGGGKVAAVTRVMRAPTPAWKAHLPYVLCLVKMEQGFTMMGHTHDGVNIGDEVEVEVKAIGDVVVPYFIANRM